MGKWDENERSFVHNHMTNRPPPHMHQLKEQEFKSTANFSHCFIIRSHFIICIPLVSLLFIGSFKMNYMVSLWAGNFIPLYAKWNKTVNPSHDTPPQKKTKTKATLPSYLFDWYLIVESSPKKVVNSGVSRCTVRPVEDSLATVKVNKSLPCRC